MKYIDKVLKTSYTLFRAAGELAVPCTYNPL